MEKGSSGAGVKERGEKEDYRRVTLTQTAYTVYASVLAEKLREEVEGKGMLPSNKTGFTKGVGAIDQIYVLNFRLNRRVVEKKGKVVVLFVDMKTVFDSVYKNILLESMRNRGAKESLVVKCKKIMEETVARVRVGNKEEEILDGERSKTMVPVEPKPMHIVKSGLKRGIGKKGMGRGKSGGKRFIC